MAFGNLFKKKKPEISKELYGERVLSRILLKCAEKSPDLFDELGIKMEFTHYLLYIEYLLFLAEKIMAQRYSASTIRVIANCTIDGLVDYMDIVPTPQKGNCKRLLHQMYQEVRSYSEEICTDISSKRGLKNLSEAFLKDCGGEKELVGDLLVFTDFTGFIIYHTSDILNDEITIV